MATGIGNQLNTPFAISASGSASGKVRKQDKFDFYSFTTTGKSSFNGTLNSLKGDANLALLSTSGSVILQSKNPKKKPESIATTLEAGTYIMRVSLGKNTKKTPYKLTIASNLVTPPNAAPTIGGSLSLAATRGNFAPSSVNLTNASLKAIDSQQSAGQLTYTLNSLPKHGNLFKNGVQLGAGGTFTQADIDGGLLAYKQTAVTPLPSSSNIVELAAADSNAAWIAGTGNNQQVFFYNAITETVQQLTTNAADYNGVKISGSTVVWEQYYSSSMESDLIYSVNGAIPMKINGSSTFNDTSVSISGNKIVFKRDDKSGTDTVNDGIQLFDITTGATTAVSSGSDNEYNPQISGSLIAWDRYYSTGNEYDVRYSTGGTSRSISPDVTLSDRAPVVSGTKIAFYRNDKSGTNVSGDGIYLFDTATSSLNQLSFSSEDVSDPAISGANVSWSRYFSSGSENDVYYSINGGSSQFVSSNSTLDDFGTQISGSKVVFYRNDKSGSNVAGDGIYLFETGALKQLSSGIESLGLPQVSGANVFWIDASGTSKGLFYDGTTSADSFGFTVSDGTSATNGTLNITIS
jgi:Cadherin-like